MTTGANRLGAGAGTATRPGVLSNGLATGIAAGAATVCVEELGAGAGAPGKLPAGLPTGLPAGLGAGARPHHQCALLKAGLGAGATIGHAGIDGACNGAPGRLEGMSIGAGAGAHG